MTVLQTPGNCRFEMVSDSAGMEGFAARTTPLWRSRMFRAQGVLLLLTATAGQALTTNVLTNPDFDIDAAGWTIVQGTEQEPGEDSDLCTSSTSLHLDSTSIMGGIAQVSQCATLPTGTLRATFRAKLLAGSVLDAHIDWKTTDTLDCSGTPVSSGVTTPVALDSSWTTIDTGPLAVGGDHVQVTFTAIGAFSFSVFYDRMFAGSADEVFVEDLEIGEPCRWAVGGP